MSKQAISTITFSGGLDISRYPEIVDAFRVCGGGEDPVIIDLSATTWIDSVFVSELLMFGRRKRRFDRIVAVATGNVERMLSVVGINRKITIVPTLQEAERFLAGDS